MSVYTKGPITLRLGDYRETLADVEPDAVITDPPYGARTHAGHNAGVSGTKSAKGGRAARRAGELETQDAWIDGSQRQTLSYGEWCGAHVAAFAGWAAQCRGWVCVMSCDGLAPYYRARLEAGGRCGFAPLPIVIPGMTVRLMGDGPSSWSVSLNVARPRGAPFSKWGTLPGYYCAPREAGHIGGKPLAIMRAIVRDYSRPGDLVCDPCAGGATTLIAAALEGRRAIGAELDPDTYEKACARIERTALTPPLPGLERAPMDGTQEGLDL